MALILESERIRSWASPPPPGAIGGYIFVNKNILAIPYELKAGTEVEAEISELCDSGGDTIKELTSKKIKFILANGSSSRDFLFISKESWEEIRDYGVILDNSYISLKIIKTSLKGNEVLIYPKRNISK